MYSLYSGSNKIKSLNLKFLFKDILNNKKISKSVNNLYFNEMQLIRMH